MSLSTLALDAGWRDHAGMWNPLVEPRFAPLDGSACHAPRLLVAPDLQAMLIPESGKISYNFFVPVGSILWGLWCQPEAVEVAGEESDLADSGAQVVEPPVLIDAATQNSGQFAFRNDAYQGPFVVGSALYCVLRQTDGVPRAFKVFKSIDAGASWTQQDTANSPAYDDAGGFCRYQVRLNPDGTTLTIGYNALVTNAANTVKWVTFDTVTDTFTAGMIPDLTDGGAGNTTGLRGDFDFVVRLNGDLLIAYSKIIGPNVTQNSLGFRVLSGGVWGALTIIAAGDDATKDGYGFASLCLDTGTGVTHVFSDKSSVVALQTFLNVAYQQISALDVATAVAQVTPDVVDYRPSYGLPCIFGDRVCLPIYDTIALGGGNLAFSAQAIIGTPLAAPVFSITELDSGASQLFDAECTQFVVEDGVLVAMWVYWPDSSTIEIRRSNFDGVSWSAVETFYDLIANPPSSPVPADQGIFAFTIAVVGSIGVVFTALDPTDTFGLAYFIVGGGAPPTPAALGIAIQITDLSLAHKFFQEPVDPRLLAVEGSDTARYPSWFLLPTPHPVVGNGLFTLDVWGPPGKLYWILVGICEVKDCNLW